jgi:hypothetical protein
MQRTTYAGHVIDLEGMLDAFEKVLAGPEARVARGPELVETARRRLARHALEYTRAALDGGRGAQEPIEEYLAFASRVWPAVRQTRTWRALQRRASGEPASHLVPAASRLAADLRWRARWRRWRWSGV